MTERPSAYEIPSFWPLILSTAPPVKPSWIVRLKAWVARMTGSLDHEGQP
jgi:hypothetical protein